MRRRSRAGDKPVKAQGRKTVAQKRRNAPKAVRRRATTAAGAETEVARLKRELDEALEQQTATSEVLSVISSSPGELEPVFRALLGNATSLCQSQFGGLFLSTADGLRNVATHGVTTAIFEYLKQAPLTVPCEHPHVPLVVAVETKRVVHITDVFAERSYIEGDPIMVRLVDNAGARTVLVVPMLKENELVGAIAVFRKEVLPFTAKQIGLVKNFAAQAVIAIENTRLLNELRESLQQQTATADVLKVISRSTFDLTSVLQTLVESAARLCDADFATVTRQKDGHLVRAEAYGYSPEFLEQLRAVPVEPGRGSLMGRALLERKAIHIEDVLADPDYTMTEVQKVGGYRTMLGVPMMREGVPIGVLTLTRSQVRSFTDKQIELVTTFADQAAIAIENVRLFEAEQQRTRELIESLEQQTAMSEVLSVISSSPGELHPVFEAMLANAVRICEAKFGQMFRFDGEAFYCAAALNAPPSLADFIRRRGRFMPEPGIPLHRVWQTKNVVRTIDDAASPDPSPSAKFGGARSHIAVPMLKDNELVGAIVIYRQEVRPFTDKQIALVQNFAAQAVIAIENTRLLNELRQRTDDLSEALEQQTATSDVLGVISSSPGELEPVFRTLLESATQICQAKFGILMRYDNGLFHPAAMHNFPPALAAYNQENAPFRPVPGSRLEQVLRTKQVTHTADDAATATPGVAARLGGARSIIVVPMLKDNELIGAILIYRQEVRPFTDKQIALVQNFAAQAVIAIENTRLLNELRQRTDDLTELLEQQTATSEVLRVISSSPGDLQPVFQVMLQNAARICEAKAGNIYRWEDSALQLVTTHNTPPAFAEFLRRTPLHATANNPVGRMQKAKSLVHTADLAAQQSYIERSDAAIVAAVDLGSVRTQLSVPLLKESDFIGAITLWRDEIRPFDDKQIALVQNFAAQAVIAIENTRLLTELRQRTSDLTESLEQQTATAEVLRVISSSPGDLEPVFTAMLENAARICEANFGVMFRFDEEVSYVVAMLNLPPAVDDFFRQRGRLKPTPGSDLDKLWNSKQVVHTLDMLASPAPSRIAKLAGVRTQLAVPMLLDEKLIGAINLYRQEVRPFTDKQIALVQNFAAQAVIAIENTRLLNELRARTADLTESLEGQTATSDVLRVISSSPGELAPVFETMLANATKLCDAQFGALFLFEGDDLRAGATHVPPSTHAEIFRRGSTIVLRDEPELPVARMQQTKSVLHITDLRTDHSYMARNPRIVSMVELAGARTFVGVPMLKESELVGVIAIFRQEVRPFTDKQIELVMSFAAQAVIAIENTRLLSELRESLLQQTATADVLKVISRSTFDLQTVLQTLVESAARLCDADKAVITRQKGEVFYRAEFFGFSPEFMNYVRDTPVEPERGTASGRALLEGRAVHIPDVKADPDYNFEALRFDDYRTILGVPMLREGVPIGVLALTRSEVRPFTEKQIELVSTFADQAAIAIENVRLFESVEARTRELTEALEQQAATSEVLNVISRSKFDLQPILQSVVDTAARLCRADTAVIFRLDQGIYRFAAGYCVDPQYMEIERTTPITPGPGTLVGRVAMRREVVRIVDAMEDPLYEKKEDAEIAQVRSMIGVPLMREGEPIGVIGLARQRVESFIDREIELVSTFADQAAIAIENVRLFESVEARTRELAKSLEDLRTAQDRLVQTEKLASLGQLTAGIAHEIKNPLNFVNNFSAVSVELIDELRGALGGAHLDSKVRAEIDEIADMLQGNLDKVVQHGKRADAIVKNMLLHSRQGSGEHRPVDINALVEDSLNLAYHGARAEKQGFDMNLERSFDPSAGEADLFPQDITRVLLNLISNGFYAATKRKAEVNGGGYQPTLTAATRNLGDNVEIRIRDNGTGIPSEVKEKMFNPFFTTKPAGEGTGLGLSISHDIIVKQHGGSIEVDTEPGEFTEFRIVLPRTGMSLIKPGEHA